MSSEEKTKNSMKKSWNDFVKGVADFSKLFHSTEPKTKFLCHDLNDYMEVCSLVADRIFASLFLGKDKFLQEEENDEFKFIEKSGHLTTKNIKIKKFDNHNKK